MLDELIDGDLGALIEPGPSVVLEVGFVAVQGGEDVPRAGSLGFHRHDGGDGNVVEDGRAKAGRFVVLSTLEEPALPHLMVAVITTRKVGKAHDRNRMRRRIRQPG